MNNKLREELLSMREQDLSLRTSLLKEGTLYEGYAEEMEALHIQNAERLNAIIQQHGWPGKTLVGKDGANAAFLIAQHAISKPDLQRAFLKSLHTAVENGEATRIQEACLSDRILFNEGHPQRYGMLFDWDENGELFTEVDDLDKANARRRQLGLKTIEEALQAHRQEIIDEGGGPPSNIKKHKALAEEWAKRVGWR